MNSAIIQITRPGDTTTIDDWLAENSGATIRFVVLLAPYELLVLYDPAA